MKQVYIYGYIDKNIESLTGAIREDGTSVTVIGYIPTFLKEEVKINIDFQEEVINFYNIEEIFLGKYKVGSDDIIILYYPTNLERYLFAEFSITYNIPKVICVSEDGIFPLEIKKEYAPENPLVYRYKGDIKIEREQIKEVCKDIVGFKCEKRYINGFLRGDYGDLFSYSCAKKAMVIYSIEEEYRIRLGELGEIYRTLGSVKLEEVEGKYLRCMVNVMGEEYLMDVYENGKILIYNLRDRFKARKIHRDYLPR